MKSGGFTMKNKINDQLLIIIISMGVFSGVMSTSMITIAFPDIVKEFNVTFGELQWRNILFFSIFAVGLPFFGKLSDRLEARKQFLFGLCLFSISSLLSGLINSWYCFLFFQSLQALADAMILPVIISLIRKLFSENKIGWAFGWFSTVLSVATLTGPALGGLIIDYTSWNGIFICLCAISLLNAILAFLYLPNVSPSNVIIKVGFLSAFCLLGAIVSMQIIFMSQTLTTKIFSLVFSLGFLALFLYGEKRKNGDLSLLPKGIFKNKIFINASIRVFCLFLVVNSIVLFVPSYMQEIHNITPVIVGGILLGQALMTFLFARYSGKVADKKPRTILSLGILTSISGSMFLLFSTSISSVIYYSVTFILIGLGGTFTMPSQNKIALLSVPSDQTGNYMGVFQMIQFITGAFAAGFFGSIIQNQKGNISIEGFQFVMIVNLIFLLLALASVVFDWRILNSRKKVDAQLNETEI